MISQRGRLLLLLVLLSVVATAGWTTALAGEKTAPPTVSTSVMSVPKPPAAPTSGEPDVGQTPHPTLTHGGSLKAPRGEGAPSMGSGTDWWLRWIFSMWAIRYQGAR